MKPLSRLRPPIAVRCFPLLAAAAFFSVPFAVSTARSSTQSWNPGGAGGGNGTWNTAITPDWDSGVTWSDGNDALFSGAGGIVTLVTPTADSLTFSASGPYVLKSGTLTLSSADVTVNSAATIASAITGDAGLFATGTSGLTLSGSSNLSSGSVTVDEGTVAISAGGSVTVLNGAVTIGDQASSNARATVSGTGSTWSYATNFFVGDSGSGTLVIANGGTVSGEAGMGYRYHYYDAVGAQPGSNGRATVSGPGSNWMNSGPLYIGESGNGAMAITNGGAVSSLAGYIGDSASSTGGVTVSGSGSSWTNSYLYVGVSGTGALLISAGGAVSSGGGIIGSNTGSSGSAAITGTGSLWNSGGSLFVGQSGSGSLVICKGGALSSSNSCSIGTNSGSAGSVTVSGTGSNWTGSGTLFVGESGTGSLLIINDGAVSDSVAYIGYGAGSTGGATVSGPGSAWAINGSLYLGRSGAGTLTVTNGGMVSVTGATTIGSKGMLRFDGKSTFNTASLAVNGGMLIGLGSATFGHSATLGAAGMNVDSNSFNLTFSGVLSGTGGLAKSGHGTLTLSGASSFSGPTSVTAGTLGLMTGAAQTAALGNTAITVDTGATFFAILGASPFSNTVTAGATGAGTAGATGAGTAGATLALNPGSAFFMADNAIGTFSLRQEISFAGPAFTIGGASGKTPYLTFDIGNGATGADQIDVSKSVSVLATGGRITIDPLSGNTYIIPGNYDLITASGGFSGVSGNGLTLTSSNLSFEGKTYHLTLANSTTTAEILTVSGPIIADSPAAATSDPTSATHSTFSAAPFAAEPAGRFTNATIAAVPEPGAASSLLSIAVLAAAWMLRHRPK